MRPGSIVDQVLHVLSTVQAQIAEFTDTGFAQIQYVLDLNKW